MLAQKARGAIILGQALHSALALHGVWINNDAPLGVTVIIRLARTALVPAWSSLRFHRLFRAFYIFRVLQPPGLVILSIEALIGPYRTLVIAPRRC
jgi:hypothetical protein